MLPNAQGSAPVFSFQAVTLHRTGHATCLAFVLL
jgi:hypothetical protein